MDCRWDYEYIGGHIRGAVHYDDAQKLVQDLLVDRICRQQRIIFYCEYSVVRSVNMSQYFTCCNMEAGFPFNDILVLKDGYHSFYPKYPEYCEGGYVTEKDERYYDEYRTHGMNVPDQGQQTLPSKSWALLP